jgi:hypothetical protein
MVKRRGSPDRRGMGAQSDFISEQFVPGEKYKEQQLLMARTLIASGVAPEQVASMLSLPISLLSGHEPPSS